MDKTWGIIFDKFYSLRRPKLQVILTSLKSQIILNFEQIYIIK
jgi:hypothetical protein